MVNVDYNSRISSFFDLNRKIISETTPEVFFTEKEKTIYQNFAKGLQSIFSNLYYGTEYISDIPQIINKLQEVYNNSILEENLQNLNKLAKCFVKGNFRYYKNREVKVIVLSEFYKFFNSASKERQKIILNNIWQRLDCIDRYVSNENDDLPF